MLFYCVKFEHNVNVSFIFTWNRLNLMHKFVCIGFLFFIHLSAQATDVINYSWYRDGRIQLKYDLYYKEVLELALNKSVLKYGEYEINRIDAGMSQNHMIALAQRGETVNLLWTMTSKAREDKLIPIRIPLLKGLGGCRIALIKKGNQLLFDELEHPADLAKLHAGQGAEWPDTKILKANNFNVTTADEHQTLYPMLAKGRFDYFPRAIHEALNEETQYPDLIVEKRFLLYYDSPFFFFVNKEHQRIAERIEYGLNLAIADGSFDRFFNEYPVTANVLRSANLENRQVIALENPLLSNDTKQALENLGSHLMCVNPQRAH